MDHSTRDLAGFGSRLIAAIIDVILLFPLYYLLARLLLFPTEIALLGAVAYGLLHPFYNICFLGIWGQTLGKKAVGIRVDLLDGSTLTWKGAFLRHSVDLIFAVILAAGWVMTIASPGLEPWWRGARYYTTIGPQHAFFEWASKLWTVWIWSELVVMLLNRNRRALHDFIGGTLVVHTGTMKQPVESI